MRFSKEEEYLRQKDKKLKKILNPLKKQKIRMKEKNNGSK